MRFPSSLARCCAAVGLAVLCAAQAAARADEVTEQRLQVLEQKIEQLRKELEAARAAAGVPADRLAELERRMDLLVREIEKLRIGEATEEAPLRSRFGLGPAASKVFGKTRGVSIGGYGELLYQRFDGRRDDGSASGLTDTADLLRAVFYFGYKWTDRVLFNSEVEFEHASTGEGAEERGEASIEFATIDALLSPAANVRAGLVLIPLGWINELHEPPVFLGSRRPQVETAIIPTTWREVGAGGFGDCGPLSYRGYLVAGLDASGFTAEGIRGGRQEGSQSKAKDLAVTGRLDAAIASGLSVGGGFFAGDSGQGLLDLDGRTIEARTTLLEAHGEWRWRHFLLRGLLARTRVGDAVRLNEALGLAGEESVGRSQGGWYGEAGVDLLGLAGNAGQQSLVLFARYEALDTQRSVPAGFARNPENDARARTAGLSWKPIPNVVVKADYQNLDNKAGSGTDQVNLALGFIY